MISIPVIGSFVSLPGVERFGWTLMHSLWQFALVALFVSAIIRAMRCSPATMRYRVLVVGLIAAILAPVATWLLLPTPSIEQSSSRAISSAESHDLARRPAQNSPVVGQLPFADDPSLEQRAKDAATASAAASPALARATHDSSTAREPATSPLEQIRSVMRPWLGWIVAAWSLGVVVCSLRPLLGWYTLRRLRRLATSSATDEVLAAARRLSQRLGLRRSVQVLYSTLAQVPVVFGYLRPVILLPVSLATSVPARQLEAILAHELAHVQRHDFLVNLLQTWVETLFFYHPGIWWLSRRIRIEREHCCDDLAVSLLGNRTEYGRALLAIEESRRQSSVLALGAGGSSLLSRIRRIVNAGADRNVSSMADRWPLALLGLAVVAAAGLMSVYRTVEAEDGSDLVAAADPKEIVSDPTKKVGDVAPAAAEYQSAGYLQKKLSAKIPDAAWGKARDGLRLAIVVRDANNTEWNDLPAATAIPAELTVRPGDEVRCQLVIENVGDHGINFTEYSYSEVGRDVKVLDRAGRKAEIQTAFLDIPVLSGHWRLLPGERFLLQMPPIHFVDKQPGKGIGYFVTTSPGEYTLQCAYTLGDLSVDAIKPVARTAEWTGELTTGALKVTVSEPPASEQKAEAGAIAANGEIVGRLIDSASGKPVAGATIACGAIINDSGKGGGTNATTDDDGRYRLTVPSPGIYNVWLKKYDKDPHMTAAADDGIRVEAGKVAKSQLNLVAGRKVAGKVIDSTGKTFAEMTVYCYSSARPQSGGVQSTKTNADGSFEFALPPGRAQVYVIEKDDKHPEIPFATSRSAEAFIQVPAEGDIPPLTLTLESSQPKFGDPSWLKRSTPGTQILRREGNQDVTGTVVDGDGKPIAGAKVFPEDGPAVSTNDKGEFHVTTLKGTQLVMHAVAPGYHAWFGTPTSGDVLKIVLESKQPPRAEQGVPPPARNPAGAASPAKPDAPKPVAPDGDVEKEVLKILRTPFNPDPAKGSWQDGAFEAQVLLSLSQVPEHDLVARTLLKVVERTEQSTRDQRRLAMMYLAGHTPAPVIPVLIKELESAVERPAKKFAAYDEIIVLGRVGEDARDAIPVLIKLLDCEDWGARGEAMDALVQIGPSSSEAMNALAKKFDDPRAVYRAANYGDFAKPLGPEFVKLLDSKIGPIRIWAAYGLAKTRYDEPRGFDVLIGNVAGGTVEDRCLAATALAALGNQAESMIPKLRAYQNDSDERVAKEVREAIRRIEHDDRIATHAQLAAKAAAARTAAKKASWFQDGNR